MDFLIIATKGMENPNDATFPFFLARAAREEGKDVGVVLASDSSPLAQSKIRENVQCVGFPPLQELYDYAQENGVPVYI